MCAAMISFKHGDAGKGQIYPRPQVTCKIAGKDVSGLADSGASISVISEKIYRSLWGNWSFTKLPMPTHLRVTGITGHQMKFVDYVMLDIEILGRIIQRPMLVASGLDHTELVLGWDTIVEEHMVIDGEENSISFKEKREGSTDEWHAAALCAVRTEKIYPRTVHKMVLEPRVGKSTMKEDTLGICYAAAGAPLMIWDSLAGVDEDGKIVMAVANFGHEPVTVKPNDCVAFMKNPEFDESEIVEGTEEFIHSMLADGGVGDYKEPETGCINKLNDKEKEEFLSQLHCKAPSEWKQRYTDLILRYNDVFSKDKFDLGWTDVMQHKIHMKSETPVFVKQFRVPYEHQSVLHEFVEELLKTGAITESRSPYNSPVFCVPKKLPPDAEPGTTAPLRCVLDFRAVNRHAIPQSYSMKDCRECLDDIGRAEAKIYSQLDLTSGFWQMSLAKECRPYTAFTVPGMSGSKFEWTVMPMGLQGSSSSFAMLIDFVLRKVKGISSYIDDVLAYSDTHEAQLKILEEVFLRFRKYGLKLNMSKSIFATNECQYLGFTLGQGTISTSKDKANAIKNFPTPRSPRATREFLGICNYFRGLIRNYHRIAEPLMKILRPDAGWKGGDMPDAALKSFQELRTLLSSEPVLTLPTKNRQYILYTDGAQGDPTSDGGMGAMLVQQDTEGVEHAIGFASRALKKNEANYSAHLLEQATIVWAIDYFEHYLKGVRFIVRSDNKPSVELGTVHKKTLSRLQEAMLEFDFVLEHCEGRNNKPADALSRNACIHAIYAIDENENSVEFEQRNCTSVGVLRRYMEFGEIPEDLTLKRWVKRMADTCVVEDGLIFHKEKRRGHREKLLLFVPETMRRKLIKEAHCRPEAGHGGVDRTAERVMMSFWWPNLRNECQEFVKECETCQLARTTKPAPAHLMPLPITTRPNERVHMDLFGDLKCSDGGNKFILVCTDSFTKWTEVVPIPNKTAEEVGKAYFERWLCRFGASEALVTDCGKEFCNQVVAEICKLWGIDKRRTSPWHPQCNSAAERYNQSIINYLRCALENHTTLDWESYLPMLQLSYNAHVHRGTKESPFYMLYGRDPRLPYTNFRKNITYGQGYAAAQMKALHEAHTRAIENMQEAEEIRKEYYNKKAQERQFHIGDRILVHFPSTPKGINRKFYKAWKICKVVAKVGPLNLRVRTLNQEKGKKSEFLIHIDRCQHASSAQIEEFCDSARAQTQGARKKVTHTMQLRSHGEREFEEIKRKRRLQFLKEIEQAEDEGFVVEIVKKNLMSQNDSHNEPGDDHEEDTNLQETDPAEDVHCPLSRSRSLDRGSENAFGPDQNYNTNEHELGAEEAPRDQSRDVYSRPARSRNDRSQNRNPGSRSSTSWPTSQNLWSRPCTTPTTPKPRTTTATMEETEEAEFWRFANKMIGAQDEPRERDTETRPPSKQKHVTWADTNSEAEDSVGGHNPTRTSGFWKKRTSSSAPDESGLSTEGPRLTGATATETLADESTPMEDTAAFPSPASSPTGQGAGQMQRENCGDRPQEENQPSSLEDQFSTTPTGMRVTRAEARRRRTIATSPTSPLQSTQGASSRNTLYLPEVPLEYQRPEQARKERTKILKAMKKRSR